MQAYFEPVPNDESCEYCSGRYPDVKAAGVNPLEHFVRYGRSEGCAMPVSPSPP